MTGVTPYDGRHSLMTKLSQINEKIVLCDGRHTLMTRFSQSNEKLVLCDGRHIPVMGVTPF